MIKNIANFEVFCRDKNFSNNLLFLRSVRLSMAKSDRYLDAKLAQRQL